MMDAADKRMLEREALRNMIQQWNANRLDLFELSEPNENLEFHGVMRFYFQDSGQKIATKCIRVASDATVSDVIETLIEKFRPDMRMLSLGSYSLWETHAPTDERRLEPHEKPLLVQLNWHADDREGRFLLKCTNDGEIPMSANTEKSDQNFKRKLSKREKKELKKKEKLSRMKSDATHDENKPVAEKLYTELPETSFTRSISNPEAVMRRRRQQKLERKLQQFRSKDGGPDTGGTLKIYGSSLCGDVPYKTLLLSVGDTAAAVVREMLDKYGLSRHDPHQFCIIQVNAADNSEYILEDDDCPLAIVMTHPHRGSIMFHVRRRPVDSQPRRRKKKAGGGSSSTATGGRPGSEPLLIETAPDGTPLENGRRIRLNDVLEVGSGNGMSLQLYGPSIQPRHCVLAAADGAYCVTPLHADAHVTLNGQRVHRTMRLQHGSVVKFGRVSTFRFVDPLQENILNRNLSQSQHFGSGSLYDRSPTSPIPDDGSGVMSPTSANSVSTAVHSPADTTLDTTNANTTNNTDYQRTMSPISTNANNQDNYSYKDEGIAPYNNNTLKLENESLIMSQHLNESKDDLMRDDNFGSAYNDREPHEHNSTLNRTANSQYKDNYETTFDLDGNVETKSICSAKSGGSGHEHRSAVPASARPGQEAILPAVLEFPEAGQVHFLNAVISRLDPHAPAFKLAPVYTLYLCARYRASTHYRPELTPTERAHKLTALLHHVATLTHATVQEKYADSAAQAFWMANSSELLHFLKCDRHISTFSTQAQELLTTTVQTSFSNLVSCFQEELGAGLGALTARTNAEPADAAAPALQALAAAMVLLRRCRVNAALTIQLFSHLFHYINAVCFNKLVTEPGAVSARWGVTMAARLALLGAWAERQGLELAADCHLARVHQAHRLIQSELRDADEVRAALSACFKLNSVQVRALLAPLQPPPDLLEMAVQHARALADQLCKADGREITLEENPWLGVGLLIPGDGFSAEVVRGVPPGLAEFLAPLQRAGLCRLAHQPHALGVWSVYMTGYQAQTSQRPRHPRVQLIQLNKNSNGMGLSIVAAKGAGQSRLGIYIKSVVPGGAAAADGRLAAGDQLLSVDGHSLVGITQEKAAEYLVRTGPTVTLEVAKQGAVLHGLATLLHQPTPPQNSRTGGRRASERDLPSRLAAESVKPSKSTPALHQVASPPPALNNTQPLPHRGVGATVNGGSVGSVPTATSAASVAWSNKSRSSHNLHAAPSHDLYQNLSTVQAHALNDRWSSLRSSTGGGNRPQSTHFTPAPPDAALAGAAPASPPDQHYPTSHGSTMSVRAAKLAEMSEEVTRRQQHQQQMQQQQMQHQMIQQPVNQQYQQQMQPMPQQIHHQQQMHQQQHLQQQQLLQQQQQLLQQQQMHNMQPHHQQMHQMPPMSPQQQMPQQRYEWQPPGPPSPQRHQPPVAPKPQGARRSELENDVQSPPPQMSTLQADEESYIASALEPPGGPAYPAGGSPRGGAPSNPWAREEREREAEARRAAARARRDANIAALLALGAQRTPHQNQQLRALQLERDFERRASQHTQEENGNDNGPLVTGVSSSVVSSVLATSVASSRLDKDEPPPHSAVDSGAGNPPPALPKSILKMQRQDVTPPTSNAHEASVEEVTMRMNNIATSLNTLSASDAPPPPPERGSSFAVMSAVRHAALSPLSPPHAPATPPPARDKRVSFHEHAPAPAPPTSLPPPLHDEELATPHRREDPDRFIEEAESMLASPTTPTTPNAPGATHTPGVIGAQEVYRDPRQRRLAEQQRAAAAAAGAGAGAVPEQLSFKEKMKMFALESGEPNTPKDKVKISRAQRDIDAVH